MKPLTGICALLALLLIIALGGCASTPAKRPAPALPPAPPIYTPTKSGDKPKAAPSAATITIIHIRPEARDYVQP